MKKTVTWLHGRSLSLNRCPLLSTISFTHEGGYEGTHDDLYEDHHRDYPQDLGIIAEGDAASQKKQWRRSDPPGRRYDRVSHL